MIYILPIIASLIGWVTNYLAVKMLFRPIRPINILGLKIQGVFPKRQEKLAISLGKLVANQLFSPEDLKYLLQENAPKVLSQVLDEKIEYFLNHYLTKKFPMLTMFVSPELKVTLKEEISKIMLDGADDFSEKIAIQVKEKIHIDTVVKEKVEKLQPEKLEELLFSIMKKEFKFIEFVGAVLGFVIGCIQVFIIQSPFLGNAL